MELKMSHLSHRKYIKKERNTFHKRQAEEETGKRRK
jgi:hypothetical protein